MIIFCSIMIEFDIIPLELKDSFKISNTMKHICNRIYSNIDDKNINDKFIEFINYKLHTEFMSLTDELCIQICKACFGVKIEFSLTYKSKELTLFGIIPDEKTHTKQFMYKKHLFYVNKDEPNVATTKVYYILDCKVKTYSILDSEVKESDEKFKDCIYFCCKYKNKYPINVCILNNPIVETNIMKITPEIY